MSGLVDLTVESGIAEIRFNRPSRLNALDIDLAEHFAAAVDSVLNDQSVRVVVISGADRAFMAGVPGSRRSRYSHRATQALSPDHPSARLFEDEYVYMQSSFRSA